MGFSWQPPMIGRMRAVILTQDSLTSKTHCCGQKKTSESRKSTALAGRGERNEPLDSPRNLQWMRLWTAMSLTHSDGYVLFTLGADLNHSHTYEMWPGHSEEHAQGKRHSHQQQHYWYDFWDADLGRPVGGDETKGQLYRGSQRSIYP